MYSKHSRQKYFFKNRLCGIFIIVFLLTHLATFAFCSPGIRTYTKEDVERENEMQHEEGIQEENEIQKTESPAMYSEEEDHTEKDDEKSLDKEQLYEVEHYTVNKLVGKPTDKINKKIISDNNAKRNLEAFRLNLRKMQEQEELDPDRIPVSEDDIADAKQRIINRLGINVPATQ